jgi:hypothetical protein
VGLTVKLQPGAACVTVKVCPPIVSVADRAAPVFAAAVNPTDPLPLPLAPLVIVIHVAVVVAVHAQPVAAVTLTVPVSPSEETASDVGAIAGEHEAAAWSTVKVFPPTVTVPVRAVVAGFAATLKEAVPFPEPLAPAVTVIHPTLLTAVHAQPATAVIVVDAVAPLGETDCDAGEIVGAQGAAPSLTVNVLPPIVSVPLRAVDAFAAALNATDPLPLPDAPDVTVNQVSLLVAVQAQPVAAVTATVPVPPVAVTD